VDFLVVHAICLFVGKDNRKVPYSLFAQALCGKSIMVVKSLYGFKNSTESFYEHLGVSLAQLDKK
jgi:hypothetical protein